MKKENLIASSIIGFELHFTSKVTDTSSHSNWIWNKSLKSLQRILRNYTLVHVHAEWCRNFVNFALNAIRMSLFFPSQYACELWETLTKRDYARNSISFSHFYLVFLTDPWVEWCCWFNEMNKMGNSCWTCDVTWDDKKIRWFAFQSPKRLSN